MFADRYELGASLGQGGMAEVFEAVAHGAHGFLRRVAIKRLRAEFGEDAHLVRMFLDEARTASHLHHSGIVAVLDYGVVDGCPFQVLELVEGWDVARLVGMAKRRRAKMPVEIALLLANQVAHALAYAHARKDESGRPLGIVHRDVKPSNILVSRSGDIKLGDFGIALARERSAVSTGFVARGTPGYMSPEQLLGGPVGPTADIFSVGVTLHALLAGASPAMDDGYEAFLSGSELRLSPDIPLDAREVIVRAVRIRPEERYASARELARALGEALAPRLETDPTTRMTQWLEELEVVRHSGVQRVATAVLVPLDAPGQFSIRAPGQVTPLTNPPRVFTETDRLDGATSSRVERTQDDDTPRDARPPLDAAKLDTTDRMPSGPPPPNPPGTSLMPALAAVPPRAPPPRVPGTPALPLHASESRPVPALTPRPSYPPRVSSERHSKSPVTARRERSSNVVIFVIASVVPFALSALGVLTYLIYRSLGKP